MREGAEDEEEERHAALVEEDGARGRALVRQVPQRRQRELEPDVDLPRGHVVPHQLQQLLHVVGLRPEARGVLSVARCVINGNEMRTHLAVGTAQRRCINSHVIRSNSEFSLSEQLALD